MIFGSTRKLISRIAAQLRAWLTSHEEQTSPCAVITFRINELNEVCKRVRPFTLRRHETIVYLLGNINDTRVDVRAAYFPKAVTTSGSFLVPGSEMAKLMRYAADCELAVVGQIHTHPGAAFHSGGDFNGMDIRHPGYVSIVVPNYGKALPDFVHIDVMQFRNDAAWHSLPETAIRILGQELT